MRDIFVNSYSQMNHTAILQTLNRLINGVIFPVQPFAETAQKWDGKPIIYAQDHPNMEALNSNFAAEIARIGGREVGYIQNSRIEIPGHPRLVADAVITDPEIDEKINAGLISLSTGFFASDDKIRITGNVTPNHVLVFDESILDRPRDLGSGFLNKFLNKADYYNNTIIKILEQRVNMTDNPTEGKPQDMTVAELNALKEVSVEEFLNIQRKHKEEREHDAAVKAEQFKQIKELEAKLKAFEQMEKDAKWTSLVPKLPKGLVTGAEVQKTREWLNKDPEGLMSHVIDIMEREHEANLQKQGREYLQNFRQEANKTTQGLCSGIFINGEEVR